MIDKKKQSKVNRQLPDKVIRDLLEQLFQITVVKAYMKQEIIKTKYNDTELNEFRNLIQGKINIAREELYELAGSLSSANTNGDDAAIAGKTLEDGSATFEKEQTNHLAARQKKFIYQLEAALMRIENKTYGICHSTGKLIQKERLVAVPHTTQSMEAKLKQA